MDDLIRRKATGTPEEFAKKLGICKSLLMLNLREIKKMGAPLKYDTNRSSYYYTEACKIQLGYRFE